MTIELRQLRYAVLAADTLSFSRAAEKLNVKQSTLSRRVMQLEERLQVKLFVRTTRGAEPTAHGRAVIEQARRIITDVDNMMSTSRAVSYGEEGRLAIGYCTALLGGPLKLTFSDYLTRYPNVQFDGVESSPEHLLRQLATGTIDVAIAPRGLSEPDILTRPLWSERLMVALLEDSPLTEAEQVYWPDLRREVFVVSANGIGPTIGQMLSAKLSSHGYRPNVVLQSASLESVLGMVSAGRFITVTTESSLGVAWPKLQFREIHDTSGPARLEYAIYWKDGHKNPALERFFNLTQERFS